MKALIEPEKKDDRADSDDDEDVVSVDIDAEIEKSKAEEAQEEAEAKGDAPVAEEAEGGNTEEAWVWGEWKWLTHMNSSKQPY